MRSHLCQLALWLTAPRRGGATASREIPPSIQRPRDGSSQVTGHLGASQDRTYGPRAAGSAGPGNVTPISSSSG